MRISDWSSDVCSSDLMAVERNPADAWSVHAVAHVMEMQGRHAEGIAWVRRGEADWSTTNNFRFHLYWHRGLYHLERHEFDEVLKLYDDHVASDIDTDMYQIGRASCRERVCQYV